MHSDFIIIRRPSSLLPVLQGALVLSFLLFGFWLGFLAAGEQRPYAAPVQAGVEPVSENEWRDKHAALERAYAIEKAAALQSARSMAELQAQKLQVERELALYQSILKPGTSIKAGLQIAGFELKPVAAGRFQFRLTLLDPKSDNKPTTVTLALALKGRQGGQAVSLDLDELAGLTDTARRFTFQHFRHLDGEFSLPADFQAQSVEVSLSAGERRAKALIEEFPWP